MAIQTRVVDYDAVGKSYQGFLAWDDAAESPRPGVMVSHTIRGRTDFEEQRAIDLAENGYVGFAADVYGVEEQGCDPDQARFNMVRLLRDRGILQTRLLASLDVMREQAEVDADQCAAIGFCFGGLCVLDMARVNAPLAGVVSFHGIFEPPGNSDDNAIDPKVLALHGWDDPLATPDSVVSLAAEMTARGADWQLHGYGGTSHSFTNPEANDPASGIIYNADANRRSRVAMYNFLDELFD